jgi:hypothetical protein
VLSLFPSGAWTAPLVVTGWTKLTSAFRRRSDAAVGAGCLPSLRRAPLCAGPVYTIPLVSEPIGGARLQRREHGDSECDGRDAAPHSARWCRTL